MIQAKWMVHDSACEKICNPNEQGCGCLIRLKATEVIRNLQAENERYREALEKIQKDGTAKWKDSDALHLDSAATISKAALEGK